LNPYVFCDRSNLCFKLCLLERGHTISDSWITRLQINLIALYNNIWDCAERSLNIDYSSVFSFFFVFLACKCILVYIVVFRIKISIRITKKNYVFLFEKNFFGSLALKPLGLYVNLLGSFVAYSEPFNLVYK
jgi:hypothetical protein